jgi:hypothetical protein
MKGFIRVNRVLSEMPYRIEAVMIRVDEIASVTDAGRGLSFLRIKGMNAYPEWKVGSDLDEIERKMQDSD